jgi:hypothetical protein
MITDDALKNIGAYIRNDLTDIPQSFADCTTCGGPTFVEFQLKPHLLIDVVMWNAGSGGASMRSLADLEESVEVPTMNRVTAPTPGEYRLRAAIEFLGTMSQEISDVQSEIGHYVAYILNANTKKWYLFDDLHEKEKEVTSGTDLKRIEFLLYTV